MLTTKNNYYCSLLHLKFKIIFLRSSLGTRAVIESEQTSLNITELTRQQCDVSFAGWQLAHKRFDTSFDRSHSISAAMRNGTFTWADVAWRCRDKRRGRNTCEVGENDRWDRKTPPPTTKIIVLHCLTTINATTNAALM